MIERYVEIVKGGVYNRGNVFDISDKNSLDLDYYGRNASEAFHSLFIHSKEYMDFKDGDGGKRNYPGKVKADYFFWDMDNPIFDQSRSDTVEIVERLMAYNKDNIRVYFSGNKGFHIVYFYPELLTLKFENEVNVVVRNFCSDIAKGLPSFDTTMYDVPQIIRTPNSRHETTGLYKIPLLYEELKVMGGNEIRELAKQQRKITYTHDPSPDEDINSLLKSCDKAVATSSTRQFNSNQLIEGIRYGFEVSQRNCGYTSLAGLFHSRGFSDDLVEAIILAVNNNSKTPLDEREISSIVNSVSKYNVDSKFSPVVSKDLYTIEDAGESWYKVITESGGCSFGERFDHINKRMKVCIPGDVIGIVANSGNGKSSIGLELGNEEAKTRMMYSVFGSLEMSRAGIFFRAATMEATHLSDEQHYVPSPDVVKELLDTEDLKKEVYDKWKHLLIIDKGGLGIDQIIEYFKLAQKVTNNRCSNLVIDYAQNLNGAENIEYAMKMYRRFKEIAKELNTKLFVLTQCNKTLPTNYTEVEKNHIEGAGSLYQVMDYIMAFWRSNDEPNRLHAKFLKDRWGNSDYKFDLVRQGLKYHSEDYLPDKPQGGF